MNQSTTTVYVGLDVHKDSIDIALARCSRAEGFRRHRRQRMKTLTTTSPSFDLRRPSRSVLRPCAFVIR